MGERDAGKKRADLRACLKNPPRLRGLGFGVAPLGGSSVVPPKGGTPNRVSKHALSLVEMVRVFVHLVPLTPALSPRERENCRPSVGKSLAVGQIECRASLNGAVPLSLTCPGAKALWRLAKHEFSTHRRQGTASSFAAAKHVLAAGGCGGGGDGYRERLSVVDDRDAPPHRRSGQGAVLDSGLDWGGCGFVRGLVFHGGLPE